jgi:uncharacterized protein YbjT (DUF2867 family)
VVAAARLPRVRPPGLTHQRSRHRPAAATDSDAADARLVDLALGSPAGLVPDAAGPQVYGMAELVRGYLRASGKHRLMVPVRLPGKAAAAFRAGVNMAPDRAVGRSTWEEFLADEVGAPQR